MQQVEHENFVLNNENYDSITWCNKQSEQNKKQETLMFPYGTNFDVPIREHWQDWGAKCTLYVVHKKTLCIGS